MLSEGAQGLISICNTAFDNNKDACNRSVISVLNATLSVGEASYDMSKITAGALILKLIASTFWTEVPLQQVGAIANEGRVVVGGRYEPPNSHVIVVYPGTPKPRGGYLVKNYNGQTFMESMSTTLYPLAMSTSIEYGNPNMWPGVMSRGDKTVWDPWANDDKFFGVKPPAVKFWARNQSK